MVIRFLISIGAVLAGSACQHNQGPVPAILSDDSPETLDALKADLAIAMDRARIDLGAGDPTAMPSVAVLPPRPTDLETSSPAMPVIFNLFIQDGRCFAVRDGSKTEIMLPNVTCRPL